MKRSSRSCRVAFTLTELIAVMTVVGALAGVVAPLAWSASDSFVSASDNRASIERCDHALRQVARLFRDAPAAAGGGADVAIARPTLVVFNSGARVELLGTTLWMAAAGNAAAPLCQQVSAFNIEYLGADGLADTRINPAQTYSVRVRIESGKVELRTVVFLAQARLDS